MSDKPELNELNISLNEPSKYDNDLDINLIEKAKQFNITARQNVYSDKRLVNFAIKTEEAEKTGEAVFIPTDIPLTRNRLKIIESNEEKSIPFDANIEPYNEEEDSDYLPSEPDSPSPKRKNLSHLDSQELSESEQIPYRTRSQAPSNEPDILKHYLEQSNELDPDEKEWFKWLSEFKTGNQTNENIEEADEDFTFTLEELEQEDEEEYRDDRAVVVSNREIQLLLNSLDKEDFDFCVLKNRSPFLKNRSLVEIPQISDQEIQIITAQLQQYIQLLVQLYMFGTFYKSYHEVSEQAKHFLDEIHYFTPESDAFKTLIISDIELKPLKLFTDSRIEHALNIINRWDGIVSGSYTPVLFGSPNDYVPKSTDIFYANILRVYNWYRLKYPPLPLKMMAFYLMESYFNTYPMLLPTIGLLDSKEPGVIHPNPVLNTCLTESTDRYRAKFSQTEMFLLVLGYLQFGDVYDKIYDNVLPSRSSKRIKTKFHNMVQFPHKMPFKAKEILMRGYVDYDLIKCTDITEKPQNLPIKGLATVESLTPLIPLWVTHLRDFRCWKRFHIYYQAIKDYGLKIRIVNDAVFALQKQSYSLVPPECLIIRNDALELEKTMSSQQNVSISSFEPSELFKSAQNILEKAYEEGILKNYTITAKTDISSLGVSLSALLFEYTKKFLGEEEFKKFLETVKNLENCDPTETIILVSRGHLEFREILAYIFSLKDPSTSNRFWHEFIQLCRNFHELEIVLLLDSYHHRKFLIFLSKLDEIKVERLTPQEVLDLIPMKLEEFQRIKFTDQDTVPSFFRLLQELDLETFTDLQYENIPPFKDITKLNDEFQNIVIESMIGMFVPSDDVNNIDHT